MRLRVLDEGQRPRARLALWLMRLVTGTRPDPVAKVAMYRPELFGRPWMQFIEPVMRGPSEWSAGEREMLAAFVSRLNSCSFCAGIHTGVAGLHGGPGVSEQLDRWRHGGVPPRLAAAFALLATANRTAGAITGDDLAAARSAGLSDDAIRDALYVAFLFDVINRLANALGFDWQTDADRMKLAKGLDRIRYHVPDFLLR